jgi:hypothetical protein
MVVGEDTKDCFASTGDMEKDPIGAVDEETSGRSDFAENVEYDSAPTQQFEGHVHTSHLSMSELAHPTGNPIKERDIVLETHNERNATMNLEVKLRGGSDWEQKPCGRSPADSHSKTHISDLGYCQQVPESNAPRAGLLATSVQVVEKSPQSSHSVAESLLKKAEITPKDYAEERASVSMWNRELEQMLQAITSVCRRASETVALVDTSASMDGALNNASGPDGDMRNPQLSAGRSDAFKAAYAAPIDDALVQSETKKGSQDAETHSISPSVNMDEEPVPNRRTSPKASPVARQRKRKVWKPLEPLEGHSGRLFDIMQRTENRELMALKSGFTVDIINVSTREVYVGNVPLRMLWHFCGVYALDRFIPKRDERPDILKIPAAEAEKSGLARVVRYMRRACKTPSVRPTGELRVPPSLDAGIETIRACRVFGLQADAKRIEDVIIDDWTDNESWYMTDEHVELIWDGYYGSLRDTVFGDAVVWFILTEVQNKSHPLAEEIRWMLDQDEYEILKARVMSEVQRKKWRQEDRERFLGRCRLERAERARKEERRTGRRSQGRMQRALWMPDVEQFASLHDAVVRRPSSEMPNLELWNRIGVLPDISVAVRPDPSNRGERPVVRRVGADTPLPYLLGPY